MTKKWCDVVIGNTTYRMAWGHKHFEKVTNKLGGQWHDIYAGEDLRKRQCIKWLKMMERKDIKDHQRALKWLYREYKS